MGNKTTDKFVAMIGFATRSGQIVYGLDALKTAKNVRVLAVSDTASDNLKDGISLLGRRLGIPVIHARSLEATVGKNVKALGVTNENMAQEMIRYADASPMYSTQSVYGGNV
ncbi:MAG: hypothetical protein NC184_01375 [Roseburia sp.]|nr:hypothetical protein [Roseburia sp.]